MEKIGPTVEAELQRLKNLRPVVLQVWGLADGTPLTPFDGKYVSRYEPEKWTPEETVGSLDELCKKIGDWLSVVDKPEDALHFENVGDATTFWRRPLESVRPFDGKPNRPLTAFNIAIVRVPPSP
jgi:hypothetical protein